MSLFDWDLFYSVYTSVFTTSSEIPVEKFNGEFFHLLYKPYGYYF
jgi:hypothetical protein